MSIRRFVVAEESMLPTLKPGEEFIASDTRQPESGDIVAFPHPGRDDFWMVKRLAAGPGEKAAGRLMGEDEAWVISDNRDATRADSRTLGPIRFASLWVRVMRLDADTFEEAVALLVSEEPGLRRIVDELGVPPFWRREPGFSTLVLLVLEQQVSLESGAAMFRRLLDLVDVVTAETVLDAGDIGLRSIGVTRQKTGYLLGLAEAVAAGDLDLGALPLVTEAEARARLVSLRGIGLWTADAYLLSALRLPDAFPVGDRALQVGTMEALGLETVPTPDELESLSLRWRPIRAVAARLIWHRYLAARGRIEPPDPAAGRMVADSA